MAISISYRLMQSKNAFLAYLLLLRDNWLATAGNMMLDYTGPLSDPQAFL